MASANFMGLGPGSSEALSCSGLLGPLSAYLAMALEDRVTTLAATGNLQGNSAGMPPRVSSRVPMRKGARRNPGRIAECRGAREKTGFRTAALSVGFFMGIR